MNGKIKFEDRLTVIRVKKDYAAPYLKHQYFSLKRTDIKTSKIFIKRIEETVNNWPPGVYYLRMASGKVFARFDLNVDGRVRQLFRNSPATGDTYPVWRFFRN